MKNVLKRNQIIVLVIALMLVSAGYLSYSGNTGLRTTGAQNIEDNSTEYAGIGDAKLVSSNTIEESEEQVAIVPNEDISNESLTNSETTNLEDNNQANDVSNNKQVEKAEQAILNEETMTSNTSGNTVLNNSLSNTTSASAKNTSKEVEEYFSSSKLNREKMYSQMIESYQKILESQTISETQKSIAQTEIQNINNTKNKIMICENLIKTKGFENLIIFVNDKSISVVVMAHTLEQDKIAQIQNIIAREMNAEVNDIHISNVTI